MNLQRWYRLRAARLEAAGLRIWMHPVEFSQLLAVLETARPELVLEWGVGGSTAAILRECPFVRRHVAVEHDAQWAGRVRAAIADPRLDLHLVEPDRPLQTSSGGRASKREYKAWCRAAETTPALLDSYVRLPATLHREYDFVFVDGRARCFCLAEGWRLLRPGGTMMLHDAQRKEYHAAVRALGSSRFLEPYGKGQMCVMHKPAAG